MPNSSLPLISCICITRNRPILLQRAIACFEAQDYPNRELVLLYETGDLSTKRALEAYHFSIPEQIKVLEVPYLPGNHLGCLRNYAIGKARGQYICQWDDDDWYHPKRLAYQYSLLYLTARAAVVLSRVIILDTSSTKAYLSCTRPWEGSILCSKEAAVRHPYVNLPKGEDTSVIFSLQQKGMLITDTGTTPMYMYIYHGDNTWDYQHFAGFYPYSSQLPETIASLAFRLAGNSGNPAENIAQLDRYFYEHYQFWKEYNSADYSPALPGKD